MQTGPRTQGVSSSGFAHVSSLPVLPSQPRDSFVLLLASPAWWLEALMCLPAFTCPYVGRAFSRNTCSTWVMKTAYTIVTVQG